MKSRFALFTAILSLFGIYLAVPASPGPLCSHEVRCPPPPIKYVYSFKLSDPLVSAQFSLETSSKASINGTPITKIVGNMTSQPLLGLSNAPMKGPVAAGFILGSYSDIKTRAQNRVFTRSNDERDGAYFNTIAFSVGQFLILLCDYEVVETGAS